MHSHSDLMSFQRGQMPVRTYNAHAKLVRHLEAILLILILCPAHVAQIEKAPTKKPTILIIGTYHMTDDREDVTTPKRQKEIEELVARLKVFRPTKIALEALSDDLQVNENFRRYVEGSYQLSRSETNQLGFRLAAELKHSKVYPIDWRNKFDLSPVFAFATANKQGAIVQKGISRVTEFDKKLGELIKTSSILEIYRFLNEEKMIRAVDDAMLTTLVHIGKDKDYVGTDVLADWYERNLKIFTNLTRIIESDEDRVLVIIGSGHVNLLRRFVEDHGGYAFEKSEKYIR